MRRIFCAAAVILSAALCFSQEITARAVADAAAEKGTPAEAVDYIAAELKKIQNPAEKRSLYAFLGSLQEALALYDDARASYAAAAALAGGDADGMPKKSSERLVLDAVRCALSAGDADTALQYLNSAVRSSKSAEILAEMRLFEQWAALCKAESAADLDEPAALLRAYLSMPSMNSVRPSVLLTLWHITGSGEYADILKKEFPQSAEAGIVTGKVQIMPAPFWYFVPRRSSAPAGAGTEKPDAGAAVPAAAQSSDADSETAEKPKRQQLGLFREKANAETLVRRLFEKGFTGAIQEDTRAGGATYYIVSVEENESCTMGTLLKTAGFECYPLF